MKSAFSTYKATAAALTFAILVLALGAFTLAASAQVQPPLDFKHNSPFSRIRAQSQLQRRGPANSSLPTGWVDGNIIRVACPPDALKLDPAVFCGYVPQPLERQYPKEETINIYFEVYLHTNPGPAESAIVPNIGGPGNTTSGFRDLWLNTFAPNLDAHDLLLIDDRGRGLSGTVGITECADSQHGKEPTIDEAVAECAAQLGDDNSRYGTGDIAQDVDAVRAALGYDKLDYYGGSYGGVDAIAYATRFGEHLRSAVLASPMGPPGLVSFGIEHYEAIATTREVRVNCMRSPSCSADHHNADAEWARLVRTIRQHPVDGMAYDANGNLTSVHFDEPVLWSLATQLQTNYLQTGEFLAAAKALERGDTAPLLRLGAESYFIFPIDFGDPTSYSVGAGAATGSVDYQVPFDWSVPPDERLQQLAEAVSDLPSDYFYPFSGAASINLRNTQAYARGGVFWEEASAPAPVVLPGAKYPHVPILALVSDIEAVAPAEEVRKVAELFPDATFLMIPGAMHESVINNQCAANLAVELLDTGDTSCTKTPESIWPAVGRFPLTAEEARPAEIDPDGENEISLAERKVVTVAVAAATDAAQRQVIGSGDGVGLRAGTFHTDFGPTKTTITLTNCAFATDVTVSGTIVGGGYPSPFVADLTVSGAGTVGGTLHIEGSFQNPGPVGKFKVRGILGGKRVAALVPEA